MREIVSPLDGILSPFGRRAAGGGPPFDPVSVFAEGENGFLGGTRFLGTTSLTPVSPTDSVGFILDTSQGADYSGGEFTGLGEELYTSPNEDSGVSWDAETRVLTFTSSGFNREGEQKNVFEAGKAYLVDAEVFTLTEGRVEIILGNIGQGEFNSPGSTSLVYVHPAGAGDDDGGLVAKNNPTTATCTISIREIPGYHAVQDSTSFKPINTADGDDFDGLDDRLITTFSPTASGSIAARLNGDTASRVIMGSQGATDGRAYLAFDASGRIAGGVGTQATATIFGGSDIRGAWHTAALTWDGSTVKLYLDGSEVYSAAQSGTVNTTVPMAIGALNANGTPAAFWDGLISNTLAIDRVLTPAEITNLHNTWSA